MTYRSLTFVHNYIADLCAFNDQLNNAFVELDKLLAEKKELQVQKERIFSDMENLRVDLMLVRQAAEFMEEERKNTENCAQILESSYQNLLEMRNLLDDDKIKNISCFSVLCKQNEVQEKLARMETLQQCDMEVNTAMERRAIVKELRKWQKLLKDAEEKNVNTQIDTEQFEQQWKVQITRATLQRNKKIVALVKLRQQIADMMKEVKDTKCEAAIKVKELSNKALAPRYKSATSSLQSALDFISHFLDDDPIEETETNDNTSNLRSILLVNRTPEELNETDQTPSPTKQVHFAPTPSPAHEEASVLSASLVNESDENAIDMMELYPEPPKQEPFKNPDGIKNRVNIISVEVLPNFNFETNEKKPDPALSFENLFSGNKSPSNNKNEVSKDFDKFVQQSTNKELKNTFQPFPEQSKDDLENNSANNVNNENFSSICNSSDDFFLNFDDAKGTENKNKTSYEL